MDQRYTHKFRNTVQNFFNHKQVNISITGFFLLLSAYVTLVVITEQPLIRPLSFTDDTTFSERDTINEIIWSSMSLFFMLAIALVAGKLVNLIMLPPLFGYLLSGIIITNVPVLKATFFLNSHFQYIAQKLALVNLIIRSGVVVDTNFLTTRPGTPLMVGLLSSTCEAIAIILPALFIFDFSVPMAIMAGYILTTVSATVSAPITVQLANEGLGTDKKIPQMIPVTSFVDNVYCLTIFTMTASVTFSDDPFMPTLVKYIGELLICAFCGIFVGWVLWWFPKANEAHTHMARVLLILFISIGVMLGMFILKCGFAGIVGVFCMILMATSQWKVDNDDSTASLISCYSSLWYYVSCPLLYVNFGTFFEFSKMNPTMVWTGLALIAMGTVTRFISSLLITTCTNLKFREQLVLCFGLLPKATVQAALGPSILLNTVNYPQYQEEGFKIVITCVMTVLITAPICRLLLTLFSPMLLKKEFVQTVQIHPEDHYITTAKIDEEVDNVITFKHFRSISNSQQDSRDDRMPYNHF